jgi:hypothetical protein
MSANRNLGCTTVFPFLDLQGTLRTASRSRAEGSISRVRLIHRASVGIVALGAALAICAGSAAATPVLVLDKGHVRRQQDRFLPAVDLPRPPKGIAPSSAGPRARSSALTVEVALKRMLDGGQITKAQYDRALVRFQRARQDLRDLSGTRRSELTAVFSTTESIVARGQLTASRVEPVFLTLERNRQWWTTGDIPANADRIRFAGSLLIYQYYPGQGLQLQMLGNWGKVNGYLNGGYAQTADMMIQQLIPVTASRAGGAAWEYYFYYAGGAPPWVSGLSQGTAIQALINAYKRLGKQRYRSLAFSALRLFQAAPPTGVRYRGKRGSHYLIYSFAPRYLVLNAFIQALNGLFDAGAPKLGNGAKARSLFRSGDREAQREIPLFDTGKWSRYSLSGEVSSTHYHTLLRDFLQDLCNRTRTRIYCRTAAKFTRELRG